MAFDPRCKELAKDFLSDQWQGTQGPAYRKLVEQLAQAIQDEIEDWLGEHDDEWRGQRRQPEDN